MAIRVKLRVRSRSTGKVLEVNALVNSGYETERPELLVPTKVAELLGVWPSPPRPYIAKDYFTTGGPIRNYVLLDEVEVSIVVDQSTGSTMCGPSHLTNRGGSTDKR
ncbi:MAG: hypothetical protein DRJ40_00815 [Thermoprotei archaeon]|nr:MAG: hypothetical protein DRJ40_00815 [Thermoprotei archaeon]